MVEITWVSSSTNIKQPDNKCILQKRSAWVLLVRLPNIQGPELLALLCRQMRHNSAEVPASADTCSLNAEIRYIKG